MSYSSLIKIISQTYLVVPFLFQPLSTRYLVCKRPYIGGAWGCTRTGGDEQVQLTWNHP